MNPVNGSPPHSGVHRPRQGHNDARCLEARFRYRAIKKIHRRRSDEARNELVCPAVVGIERRTDLLYPAAFHHDDPVGDGHGLHLIVGDLEGGRFQLMMQRLDLAAHNDAQLRVDVRQRLAE